MSKDKIEIVITGGEDEEPRRIGFQYLGPDVSGPREAFAETIAASIGKALGVEILRRMSPPPAVSVRL